MNKKIAKMDANLSDVVQFISEDEVKTEMGEAFASFMLNPIITWAKFILTDDRKNANGERVPKTEFPNLMKSGIHMPVKMANGEISQGHPGTKPLGTITHLKEVTSEDGTSAIVAIAALWSQERPADVEFIKTRFAEKLPVDVSWEILYNDATFNSETQSMDLNGTILRAATIVGNPAYQGRTPFLSIAAIKKSEATIDTNMEEDTVDLTQLQAEVDRLKAELSDALSAKESLAGVDTKLAEAQAEVTRLTELNTQNETELAELRTFKAQADAEAEKAQKLEEVKQKFVEAGIEKDEEYFTDNADRLIAMDSEILDFMISQFKANDESKTTSTSSTKTKIPALLNEDNSISAPTQDEIVKALRERKAKK